MSGARSLSLIPPVMLGVRSWKLRSQGGELIPLSNQLSGAVGGRASSALISIVKASLRAVFRGGSFVDGCGSAAQPVPWRCLRLFVAGGLLLAAWRKTRLATRQGLMLWRDVRRMRPGGEGACVTTLLEMPSGPRDKTSDAMRDLVVSPAMGVSTLEPGVVWARE